MARACYVTDMQSKTPSSRLADKSIQKGVSIAGGADVRRSFHVSDKIEHIGNVLKTSFKKGPGALLLHGNQINAHIPLDN